MYVNPNQNPRSMGTRDRWRVPGRRRRVGTTWVCPKSTHVRVKVAMDLAPEGPDHRRRLGRRHHHRGHIGYRGEIQDHGAPKGGVGEQAPGAGVLVASLLRRRRGEEEQRSGCKFAFSSRRCFGSGGARRSRGVDVSFLSDGRQNIGQMRAFLIHFSPFPLFG